MGCKVREKEKRKKTQIRQQYKIEKRKIKHVHLEKKNLQCKKVS